MVVWLVGFALYVAVCCCLCVAAKREVILVLFGLLFFGLLHQITNNVVYKITKNILLYVIPGIIYGT